VSTAPSQTPPDAALMQLILGKGISMAPSVVAKRLLADGHRTIAELAARTESHAPTLYRALRTLASLGVFAE
jgi:predicted transcriptional regulator